MRRRARCLLAVAFLLAAGRAAAQGPPGKPPVVFEDPDLPDRQKELLARYAETVSRWAMVQRVVAAVVEQNARELSREQIVEVDAAWQRGENPDGLPAQLMSNPCAQALQELLIPPVNAGYGDAFVADSRGALVCMSQRTSDYDQSDEDKWRRAWADGAGAVFISAPNQDESVRTEVVHIAVPVRSAGRTIGVLVASRLVGG